MANKSFSLDLRAFAEKAKGAVDKVAREAIIDVGNRVTQRTPVGDATLWKSKPPKGYVGGHARANWGHAVDAPLTVEFPDIDASGAASIDRITTDVAASPAAAMHYLSNNVPYAVRLEDGWSTQAPAGMVGLVVVEWSDIVAGAVSKVNGGA